MTQDTGLLPEMMAGREQFDMVMRGYDRHQVDTYVNHLETMARDLEERLVQAEQAAGQGQQEAAEARAILERGRPTFESLGERIAAILSMAEEEA
ncbi:MAG: DivIVA domain-containing protein, partial [Actinobacteria bacterium]|nr:DivIVA domain-containing protein [Actinomycetota bacterium]